MVIGYCLITLRPGTFTINSQDPQLVSPVVRGGPAVMCHAQCSCTYARCSCSSVIGPVLLCSVSAPVAAGVCTTDLAAG